MTRIGFALGLLLAVVIASPGCGGGDASSAETAGKSTTAREPSAETQPDKPKKGAWGVVFGAEGESLGLILYDLSGHTLYTFSGDKGTTSACYGACAKAWPPALTKGKARAGGEASPGKVGTTKRKDGTVQLTYAGHPLYTYTPDKQADTKGNGVHAFGGEWHAIRPNGQTP